jgi:tRNA A-37 threonylcarbamoyl transferase component Bud32
MESEQSNLSLASEQHLPGDTPTPAASWVSLPGAGSGGYPFLAPPAEPDEIGRLGNFRVLRLLGQGGMGMVFLAEDQTLRRPVALKVMKPDLSDASEAWPRFLREARTMAAIKHEHLVTIYQAAQEGSVVYLALELLEGESLDDRMKRPPPLQVAEILRLAREIATGLAVIHRNGLIHRDIKPANVWLEAPKGHVKILDFGLARAVKDEAQITQPGLIVGTPAFMSPEQASEQPIDARSDLFSLGCILYCLCTGFQPFPGSTTMAVLTSLAVDNPRPVLQLNPAIPPALSDLVMQLLAKKPAERPASAEVVIEAVRRLEGPLPDTSSGAIPVALPVNMAPWQWPAFLRQPPGRKGVLIGAFALVAVLVLVVALRSAFAPAPAARPRTTPASQPAQEWVSLTSLKQAEAKLHYPPPPPPKDKDFGKDPPPKDKELDQRESARFWDASITVDGKRPGSFIFMHGNPEHEGPASVTYELGGRYSTFRTKVALSDTAGDVVAAVTFTVYADNEPIWSSRPIKVPRQIQECTRSVKGKQKLRLELTVDGPIRGTHGVWIEPSVEK